MSEYRRFFIYGDESAQKRFFDACHFFQNGDRDENPRADPIVSSSAGNEITVERDMVLTARTVAAAAGLKLESYDDHEAQIRNIRSVITRGFGKVTELRNYFGGSHLLETGNARQLLNDLGNILDEINRDITAAINSRAM